MAQLDAALDTWERWGVAGLMVDFMNRDDQQMVAFYDEVARKAADHHLTVVYHGAYKPTGESRTWPNVISREAVRGTEYNKFPQTPDNPADPENLGSTAGHEATTPFVRMLAGPMDIHEGGFDAVAPGHLVHRQTAPEVIGTRARALATYIAVARRKGRDWWLSAISDAQARTLKVPLSMPVGGAWRLDAYAHPRRSRQARHEIGRVVARARQTLSLGQAGGYAARLSPLAD